MSLYFFYSCKNLLVSANNILFRKLRMILRYFHGVQSIFKIFSNTKAFSYKMTVKYLCNFATTVIECCLKYLISPH